MKVIKWLYPGLKVKRWFLIVLMGFIFATTGLYIILSSQDIFNNLIKSNFNITGIILFILGLIIIIIGLKKFVFSVFEALLPNNNNNIVELLYQKRQLKKGPKIVVIGGGTGLSVLLRGLKKYTSNLTAVVAVTDDGGSSGKLRGELGILPPGDIRNCLLALADEETLMEKLLNFRFNRGSELKGHNLGNLMIAAMNEISGDFYTAVQELSRVLAVKGEVLPSTLQPVKLKAEMKNGDIVTGETNIVNHGSKIIKVFLNDENCKSLKSVVKAIDEADAVVLGPGSLYTSIIPNLLVKDINYAIKKSEAPVFYVCNIMTQLGETDNYSAADHLKVLEKHTYNKIVNYIIVNIENISDEILKRYRHEGAKPVFLDEEIIREYDVKLIKSKLLKIQNFARHDHEKLAQIIIEEILKLKTGTEKVKIFGLLSKVR